MYYPANKSRQSVPLPPTRSWGVTFLLTGLVLLLVVFAVGTVLNSLLLRKLNGMGTPVLSAEYTAQHFLGELTQHAYSWAYQDLDLRITEADFQSQAKAVDACAGDLLSYQKVEKEQIDGTDHITYYISRIQISYQMTLLLTRNGKGVWRITGYRNGKTPYDDLGPGQPSC